MFSQILRLSKQSIIYGLGVAASQIVGFFLIPVYTRYLTPGDYGTLEIFQVTLWVLAIILIMGMSSAMFRSYFLLEDKEQRRKVLSTAFIFLTATSALLSVVLFLLAGNFSTLFFDSGEYQRYFWVIFGTLFFDIGIQVGLATLRAREEAPKYAVVTMIRVVASLSLNVVFVVVLHRGVLGILESGLITAAAIYLLLLAGVVRRAGLGFSFDELKRMLAFGLPLVPAGLAAWILTLGDRYFLQFLSTPEELGLYSLGYRFGLVISALFVGPFNLAWAPFVFSIAREPTARQTYSRALTYFVLVAGFFALALSTLAQEALAVVATPAFQGAYKVVPLIALSYVLFGCYFIVNIGIGLEAKTKYSPIIVGSAAALNLGLNYLLIPGYGMMGAAYATVVSYLALTVVAFFVSRRFYKVSYEWGRVTTVFLVAAAVYAGSVFVGNSYEMVHSHVVVGAFKLILLLAYPLLLYLLRFFKPEEIQAVKEVARLAPGYVKQRLGRRKPAREEMEKTFEDPDV